MDQDVVETVLNEIVQSVTDLLIEEKQNSGPDDESKSEEIETDSSPTEKIGNDEKLEDVEENKIHLSDSNSSDLEKINEGSGSIGIVTDHTEAIEPYSSDNSETGGNFEGTGSREKKSGLPEARVNKENKPYSVANNEPSVIVINNYSNKSETSSDSDSDDAEKSRRVPKRNSSRKRKKKSKSLQVDNEILSQPTDIDTAKNTDAEVTNVRRTDEDDDRAFKENLPIAQSLSEVDTTIKTNRNECDEERIQITELNRSPRIYGRKQRHQVEDLEAPSTSTNFVPSVIVINDYSNGSSTSTHSTGEMQRRTERNFAFLSDSDFSDVEISDHTLGYRNRAYEGSEEIDLGNEEIENAPEPELRTIGFDDSYIWSTTGLLKFTQVICCITMYISIGLCRFYSRYIQIYCIIGACISVFLLIVYSYRIQMVHWKSYKIRLLFSEFVYLVVYAACDTVFAIIKFEFNEEANYRERMATMILMTSTGIAASTYCYDAISSYTSMIEAGENNPEEKKLIISYLPTCSQSTRSEICDIFHTCIL